MKHEINLLSIPSFPLFTIHKMSPEAGKSKALAHQGVSKHAEALPDCRSVTTVIQKRDIVYSWKLHMLRFYWCPKWGGLSPKIPWLVIFPMKVALFIGYPVDIPWFVDQPNQYQNHSPCASPVRNSCGAWKACTLCKGSSLGGLVGKFGKPWFAPSNTVWEVPANFRIWKMDENGPHGRPQEFASPVIQQDPSMTKPSCWNRPQHARPSMLIASQWNRVTHSIFANSKQDQNHNVLQYVCWKTIVIKKKKNQANM